ncbi:MAG: DUF29 domain-containing protein [Sphingomonadaceae bacterium]
MTKPVRLEVPATAPTYAADGFGWAMAQGRMLRERRGDAIDWDNLAEEIETMGRSERRSLESNLMQIALHVIQWRVQPGRRGMSWWLSILNHRDAAMRDLRDNPSLKPELQTLLDDALKTARRTAQAETRLPRATIDGVAVTIGDCLDLEFEQPTRD